MATFSSSGAEYDRLKQLLRNRGALTAYLASLKKTADEFKEKQRKISKGRAIGRDSETGDFWIQTPYGKVLASSITSGSLGDVNVAEGEGGTYADSKPGWNRRF